jgi:hypothetical protein
MAYERLMEYIDRVRYEPNQRTFLSSRAVGVACPQVIKCYVETHPITINNHRSQFIQLDRLSIRCYMARLLLCASRVRYVWASLGGWEGEGCIGHLERWTVECKWDEDGVRDETRRSWDAIYDVTDRADITRQPYPEL